MQAHIKLLRYAPLIAMEGRTGERTSRLLHQLHGVRGGVVPIMIVADNLHTREPVVVQKSSECYPNSSLL